MHSISNHYGKRTKGRSGKKYQYRGPRSCLYLYSKKSCSGKSTIIPSTVDTRNSSTPSHPIFSQTVAHKTTTEGTVVQGGASRVLGGRDEIRSQTATIERWVPPSAIKRDALPENSDDVKFRKVRSILNKLTPQTFDRLSDELIHVGLDSQSLLKGVILLIFEKALQEPKYVCMYAQLCKKLSKRVPNFDPPNPDQTTTFRRLLLLKCQDEYTNRARAYAVYDQRTERLTPDEEEEKHLVKRKMLGNIKFIGELGKLEMLTHSILHRCCEELVKKTKAEDLECLCQIMSTCGHLLDNDKGKFLMDQYFARIQELSKNEKLPSRIRFMLQDVLELRSNQWLQRQSVSVKESPKPIEDIRREAQEEFGLVDNTRSEDFRYIPIDSSKRGRPLGSRKMTGMEDVFAPFPIGVSSLGTGPGVITPGEKQLGQDTNGFHGGPMNAFRPPGGMRTFNNQQNMQGVINHPFFAPHKNNKMNHNANQQQQYSNMNHQMRNNHNNMVNNGHGYEKAPVAPRFRKGNNGPPNMNGGSPSINPLPNVSKEELSLRPPPNSMIKMFPQAPKPNMYGTSYNDTAKSTLPKLSPPRIVSPKETALADAAKTTIEKPKPKKEKGPTKDEIAKKVDGILENYKGNNNNEEAIDSFKRMEIPEKFIGTALTSALNKAMDSNESDRELIYGLILQLVESEVITQNQFLDAFRSMLDLMIDLEADIPRIKSYVASLAARAICQKKLTLTEVGDSTENGNHYPFLLLVLQQLSKVIDKAELCTMFEESKIQMINTLPKIDRTKDRMTEILEERELSFLFPLLKIQTEMTKQLQINPNAEDFSTWVKERVDPAHRTAHGFISSLVSVIFKYIIQEVSKNQTDQTEKAIRDSERALLSNFKPIISEYLSERVDLQVIAIYALQSSWFSMDCPKVMLLRWFVNMYELEIIEEDAFLKWKEDIRDDYPGKGNALFQVNQWLLWLEQVDEEEEGDDEQDN